MRKTYNLLNKIRYEMVIVLTVCIVLLFDLITKVLTDGKSYAMVNGFIRVFSTHNTGGAWSIFSSQTLGLIIVTFIFILLMLAFNFFFKRKNWFYCVSFGLFFSGAIGNLIDRLKYGYVRDFIKLEFINFPIFNIADCAICIGVFCLCLYLLFFAKKGEQK